MRDENILGINMIPDEMMTYVNMFGTGMELVIVSEGDSRLVVTISTLR